MRPALVISLVFLLLLVEVQGIRLDQGFISHVHQRIHEEKKSKLNEVEASGGGGGVREAVLCKDEHCSGRSRKLFTKATSTSTSTTTKSVKSRGTKVDSTSKRQSNDERFNGKEENFSIQSSPTSKHREVVVVPKRYPDIIDIAGMDYSPAKRKPPIHN